MNIEYSINSVNINNAIFNIIIPIYNFYIFSKINIQLIIILDINF